MMAFFFVFFTGLGIYLSQVLPHAAGGFREHPCYCFGINIDQAKYRRKKRAGPETDIEEGLAEAQNFEKLNKEKYQDSVKAGNVLRIQHLTKYYSAENKAVDDLCVDMYGGEIFALLGHNGAGKTTTIKMVIG